jgi:hypothetical protein
VGRGCLTSFPAWQATRHPARREFSIGRAPMTW